MKGRTILPSDGLAAGGRRERVGVFVVAGLVVTIVGAYLALNAVRGGDADRGLLPYQALARTLPASDERLFRALRQGLLAAEAERARASRWPDASALAAQGVAPFAPDAADAGASYRWERFAQGVTVNYLGRPSDPSKPAWLLTVQEPEPGALPDPAPNDEQHHRLPDKTTLHVYTWMHRYGGQVEAAFVPQPQNAGWIEILSAPPNPVPSRR